MSVDVSASSQPKMREEVPEYGFAHSRASHTMAFLIPAIESFCPEIGAGSRVIDIGCGNGFLAGHFLKKGCTVVGLDASAEGIAIARKAYPDGRFEQLIASDTVLEELGEKPFDLALSTEVVEHLYLPRLWARGCFGALRPGGRLVCTTPFHGYLKNIVIAATGKYDSHHNPMWDGGHIKFWSARTLGSLLEETGFCDIRWKGAGRIPLLWKGLVMTGIRPA